METVGFAYLVLWTACIPTAALITALRGYTAIYGLLLAFFSIAIPLVGPVLAVVAAERWTREPPESPMHPVRWPGRPGPKRRLQPQTE